MELTAVIPSIRKEDYPVLFAYLHELLRSANVESYECSNSGLQMVGRQKVADDPAEVARSFAATGALDTLSFPEIPRGAVSFSADELRLTSASPEWLREQVAAWQSAGGDPGRFEFGTSKVEQPIAAEWASVWPAVRWVLGCAGGSGAFEARWYRADGAASIFRSAGNDPSVAFRAEVVDPARIASLECRNGRNLGSIALRDSDTRLRVVSPDLSAAIAAIERWPQKAKA